MRIALRALQPLPILLLLAAAPDDAAAQVVSGFSDIAIQCVGCEVESYSRTSLDYVANYYYDPRADGYLSRGGTIQESNSVTGISSADEAAFYLSTPLVYDTTFQIQTNHWIRAYYQVYVDGSWQYNDYYGFSLLANGNYGGSHSFNPPQTQTYIVSRDIYLGTTYTGFSSPSPIVSGITISGNPVRGGSGSVEIYGQYFDGLQSVAVSGGGVTTNTTYESDTQVNIGYSIASTAASGDRDLTVTTLFGPSNAETFEIYDPTPQVSAVTPNAWPVGATTHFTIWGQYFGSQPTVSVSGGGVTGSGTTFKSDTQINAWATVSSDSTGGTATISIASTGYAGSGFQQEPSGGGAMTQTTATTVFNYTLSQSPAVLNLSTGDTDKQITSTVSVAAMGFTPAFSVGLQENPNSSCQATLGFSNDSGTGSAQTTVTAGEAGCSGIFNAIATTGGKVSTGSTQIVVPPQILIKMLVGEAGGQTAAGDMTQPAIGVAARNRFDDPDFDSPSTYQAAIVPEQFEGLNNPVANALENGPEPPLTHASGVFSNAIGAIVENATCFWSPTTAEWTIVQAALDSGTTTFPENVGDPDCYLPNERQALVKTSVADNASGGESAGAPAFLFIQQRDSTAPAVRRID